MKKKDLKKWYEDYKRTLACEECGYLGSRCPGSIDHHHRDPKEKFNTIGFLVKNGFSMAIIQEEIAKCRALCSNCHTELHYAERHDRPVHPNSLLGVKLPPPIETNLFPEDNPTGPVRVNANTANRYNWGKKMKVRI